MPKPAPTAASESAGASPVKESFPPEQTADGAVQPRWSDIDGFWLSFTGGEFRHALEETVSGDASRGYVFRFEAEGHAPFVTRVYQADEGEVRLEVQLRPVLDIAAVTYTPDGRVANGAQVGLVAPGSDLHLVPGGFAGDLGYALAWLRRADAAGRFVVPDDESVQRVVIAHPEGYAEVTLGELRKARTVRLDPWARVDGLWQVNGQPVTNGEVRLQWSRPRVNAPALDLFLAHTDANGHFAFAQIPPGTFELQTWQTGSERRAERDDLKATTFDARSGETNQVFLGDAGVTSGQ